MDEIKYSRWFQGKRAYGYVARVGDHEMRVISIGARFGVHGRRWRCDCELPDGGGYYKSQFGRTRDAAVMKMLSHIRHHRPCQ